MRNAVGDSMEAVAGWHVFDLALVNEGINPTSALSEAVIAELSCTLLSMGWRNPHRRATSNPGSHS
jgi:hypothetical protein